MSAEQDAATALQIIVRVEGKIDSLLREVSDVRERMSGHDEWRKSVEDDRREMREEIKDLRKEVTEGKVKLASVLGYAAGAGAVVALVVSAIAHFFGAK